MDEGCSGQTCQCVIGQPLGEWRPNSISGFCALAGSREPLVRRAILQVCRERFSLFPNLLDMGEESPPVLPGQALETEEAHHPLKGTWKADGLIRHGLSGGEPKFERNGLVGARAGFLSKVLEHPIRLMMTTKGDQCGIGCSGPESIRPVSVLEEGDLIALLGELTGGCEAGEAGTGDHHCLGGRGSHENRERSHTRRAISTR